MTEAPPAERGPTLPSHGEHGRSAVSRRPWGVDAKGLARQLLLAAGVLWIVLAGLAQMRKSSVDIESSAAAYRVARSIAGQAPSDGRAAGGQSAGYVVVLAVLALTTPGTLDALGCWAGETGDRARCKATMLPFVIACQMLAALAVLLIAYRLAASLSGDADIAVLAAILTFMSMRLGEQAGTVRGGVWYPLLLLLHVLLLQQAWASRSKLGAAGAGAILLIAVLFEPLAIVLAPVGIVLLIVIGVPEERRPTGVLLATAFVIGALATTAATAILAVSHGLDLSLLPRRFAVLLAQRVPFQSLGIGTWTAALLTPIPWLGDMLLALLPADEARKLAVGTTRGSLALAGVSTVYPDAMARTGGSSQASAALLILRERMVDQPLAYLLSLPVVMMRGIFAGGGIIALVGLLHAPTMLRYAVAEGRLGRHLLVVVPAVVLFVANALLTSNEFWLNPMLPVLYAYAIVYVAGGW